MAALPLDGIRVIDITGVWSGPGACRNLAALGAEVIRVESLRYFPATSRGQVAYPNPKVVASSSGLAAAYPGKDPGADPYNRYGPFLVTSVNKLSCTIELDEPEGQEAFRRLLAISDVVVENNSRRTAEVMGLTWEKLSPINPRLIVVRMTPLGLSGPYADALGYGIHFEAVSGVAALRGYEDGDPSQAGLSYHMDDMSAQGGAFAVMAALYQRNRTGEGQLIEFAQGEHLMQGAGAAFLIAAMDGHEERPIGNRHASYLQGCYPCRGDEQWIALSIVTEAHWRAFAGVIGTPDWVDQPSYATASSRHRHQDELDPLIATATRRHDKMALFHMLQAAGVPAAPVFSEADLYADAHLAERRFFQTMTHPSAGTHVYPGFAARFSGFEPRWDRPAPLVGEHNEYVYKELLGYDDEGYDDLVRRSLIGTAY